MKNKAIKITLKREQYNGGDDYRITSISNTLFVMIGTREFPVNSLLTPVQAETVCRDGNYDVVVRSEPIC